MTPLGPCALLAHPTSDVVREIVSLCRSVRLRTALGAYETTNQVNPRVRRGGRDTIRRALRRQVSASYWVWL